MPVRGEGSVKRLGAILDPTQLWPQVKERGKKDWLEVF